MNKIKSTKPLLFNNQTIFEFDEIICDDSVTILNSNIDILPKITCKFLFILNSSINKTNTINVSNGNLLISCLKKLKHLSDIYIKGDLIISNTDIEIINNSKINNNVSITYSSLIEVPEIEIKGSKLNLSNNKIEYIQLLDLDLDIDLSYNPINSIGSISCRNLMLSNLNLKNVKELKVTNDLTINECDCAILPNLNVCNNLYLYNLDVQRLEKNSFVKGEIIFNNCDRFLLWYNQNYKKV